MKRQKIIFTFFFAILLSISILSSPGMAQQASPTATATIPALSQDKDVLNLPVNLSHSGAASQPRIVASPDGVMQVFWIDQFDGLLASTFNGSEWSKPFPVPLPSVTKKTDQNIIVYMPEIIEDNSGNVHVFWFGKTNAETQTHPLYHSQMTIGSNHWLSPSKVANSVISFSLATPSHSDIRIAYIRTLNEPEAPAGVYYKYWNNYSQSWSSPHLVYTSIYYRLVTSETSWLKISANDNNQINVIWFDPEKNVNYSSDSIDNGTTWTAPELIQSKEEDIRSPQSIMLSHLLIQNWQKNLNKCILEQKLKFIDGSTIANSQEVITTTLQITPQWSNPTQILQSTSECPESGRFFPDPDNNIIFWLWGLNSNTLYLSAWRLDKNNWSEPKTFGFNFTDSESKRVVNLSNLHATLMGGKLAITGTDNSTNEIWFIQSEKNTTEMTFSEPSPWHSVEKIQEINKVPLNFNDLGPPSILVDNNQVIHIIWSQLTNEDYNKTNIFHSDWNGLISSQPSVIFPSESNANHRQINSLIGFDNRINLAWVQNPAGEIFYSWATAEQAYSPDGWLQQIKIQGTKNASFPLLGADSLGNLYLLYVIQFNEGRGIYLTQSHDRGETWDKPKIILNGVKQNIEHINRPSFVVSPNGMLFVAYVNDVLPGSGSPLEIDFISSTDQGESWSKPLALTDENMDYPKLAISKGKLHLLYGSLNDRTILHQWTSVDNFSKAEKDWSIAETILGFNNVNLPFGITTSGSLLDNDGEGSLYLISLDTYGNFLYSQYMENTWLKPEIFSNRPTVWDKNYPTFSPLLSTNTNPRGGILGIAWFGTAPDPDNIHSSGIVSLFLTSRSIPKVDIANSSLPVPKTPTSAPTKTLLSTSFPTATPIINNSPVPAKENSFLPLIIGTSVAGITVVLILVVLFNRKYKH